MLIGEQFSDRNLDAIWIADKLMAISEGKFQGFDFHVDYVGIERLASGEFQPLEDVERQEHRHPLAVGRVLMDRNSVAKVDRHRLSDLRREVREIIEREVTIFAIGNRHNRLGQGAAVVVVPRRLNRVDP